MERNRLQDCDPDIPNQFFVQFEDQFNYNHTTKIEIFLHTENTERFSVSMSLIVRRTIIITRRFSENVS